MVVCFLFFIEQETAFDIRISDWSSDVCSSDLRIFSTLSSASPLTATASGVRTPPGQTALTRMPRGPNSSAAACVAATTAAFDIAYSPQPGVPRIPESEDVLMIDPPSLIRFAASRFPRSEEHTSEPQPLMTNPY